MGQWGKKDLRAAASRRALALATTASMLLVAASCAAQAQSGSRSRQVAGRLPASTLACPNAGQDLLKLPELISSGGVLSGTIMLIDEQQRLPVSVAPAAPTCNPQFVRNFRGVGAKPDAIQALPSSQPDYPDPQPGPTLRARVGDIVQLTLVNEVNSNDFDANVDREACTQVLPNQGTTPFTGYPGNTNDAYPNCLHASSTANLHFHGIHTSPAGTADNIFVQVRPLPRDNQGNLTTTADQVTAGLAPFFDKCKDALRNPLAEWPALWSDLPLSWRFRQYELLKQYDAGNPTQMLWQQNDEQIQKGGWPQYYIGAYPYCFPLPKYEANSNTSPRMGQAPGTHWYHAHKHGATSINVANGMTGAFIVEGKYDDDLNAAYGDFVLKDSTHWNTRAQPVLVMNQLSVAPNLQNGVANVDFTVNGRMKPTIHMQPGEVQLWRILNTSARSAAYFVPPAGGLQWRQLAQDGVQFADENYAGSLNKPLFMASGNRVDLLVQAPSAPTSGASALVPIQIQNVVARSAVGAPSNNVTLFNVEVSGPPVTRDGKPAAMTLLEHSPEMPAFLTNITDQEVANGAVVRLNFNSVSVNPQPPAGAFGPYKHSINGQQFSDTINITVPLNTAQEWFIMNSTAGLTAPSGGSLGPGAIDHPFHIHVNPYQVVEVFDPNEAVRGADGLPTQKPKYVFEPTGDPSQCLLNINDPSTWKPCDKPSAHPIWYDTFAIPAARVVTLSSGQTTVVVPGHFRMRSRFVDYPGQYVLHCHILAHEDRGMMFVVEVLGDKPIVAMHHH